MNQIKVFLDCGYHQGQGLELFTRLLNITDHWITWCWEPNPECWRYFPKRAGPNQYFHQEAIWVHSDGVEFRQEDHKKSATGSPIKVKAARHDGWGSSCMPGYEVPHLGEPVKVASRDFAEVLRLFINPRYEVYCKMDIEGAEFPVLRRVMKETYENEEGLQVPLLSVVRQLYIEWHDRFLPKETIETRMRLQEYCSKATNLHYHE